MVFKVALSEKAHVVRGMRHYRVLQGYVAMGVLRRPGYRSSDNNIFLGDFNIHPGDVGNSYVDTVTSFPNAVKIYDPIPADWSDHMQITFSLTGSYTKT
ncbi:hypothetical protein NDU88_001786 [Pleurodeles waltl]|uniref:Endonuclease/exonuclease/phosphatase domain-containing protein n=1 Tax=Pleurodeles waltl TaxID=8319 RepID=A0AAV7R881_PLEWA|nr:hypothetical protein NDU88_001786 [Pleurodeles waltl]